MELFDVYPLYNITPVKAQGMYVYDDQGQEYLDFYGGHAVISIGHSHPTFVKRVHQQLQDLVFYSNAIQNPLQQQLAKRMTSCSGMKDYSLFMCNSGAEATENALKVASFQTGKKRVIAFKNSFHGRTSAAVAVTDIPSIQAPVNSGHEVTFLGFNDVDSLLAELEKGDVCAVIFEAIQGVGGLDEPSAEFVKAMNKLCAEHGAFLIADEVQAGCGRTGDYFAFQKYGIRPQVITMAKGIGNGFPVAAVMFHPDCEARHGMLGTTFGGSHLACAAALAVLELMENEGIMAGVGELESYFRDCASKVPAIRAVKGRGLMLGIEFDTEVSTLRKELLYTHHIFTGGSNNKKLLRILPPLNIEKKHIDCFFEALNKSLE